MSHLDRPKTLKNLYVSSCGEAAKAPSTNYTTSEWFQLDSSNYDIHTVHVIYIATAPSNETKFFVDLLDNSYSKRLANDGWITKHEKVVPKCS